MDCGDCVYNLPGAAPRKEKEEHELKVLRLQAAQASGNPSIGNVKAPCPKIPPFDESKDN